jgi:flagellin
VGSFISLQTNVTSLHAQQDMNVNDAFQNNTILQLSSGYRINSSADDPAGLAVANQYNSDIAEAQQGVRNANDGLSQLQIVDGGLGNISTILNQLKSLATESASGTFTGNRGTLNLEYQSLVSEITRQADNIQLNSGGNLNTQLSVYIGGNRTSNVSGTGVVKIDLSGSANAVDATSLGLQGTTVIGGGTSFNATNTVTNLSNANALFNIAVGTGTNAGDETFAVTYATAAGTVATSTISVPATATGVTGSDFVTSVNTALTNAGITGITAQIGANGDLQFSGGNLLSVAAGTSGTAPTDLAVTSGATLLNGANYQATSALTAFTPGSSETLNLTVGGTNYALSLSGATSGTNAADNVADAVASLNEQLKGSGVYATADASGNITLQSASAFSLAETNNTAGAGTPATGEVLGTSPGDETSGVVLQTVPVAFTPFTGSTEEDLALTVNGTTGDFELNSSNASSASAASNYIWDTEGFIAEPGSGTLDFENLGTSWTLQVTGYTAGAGAPGAGSLFGTTPGAITVTAPTTSASAVGNAEDAITAINSAVTALGLVQGAVGSGENTLNYAISLAQSQVTNFSAAESQIMDANVAAEAADLTKAQVLQQASIAAMAQANSSPEAILKLLQ